MKWGGGGGGEGGVGGHESIAQAYTGKTQTKVYVCYLSRANLN